MRKHIARDAMRKLPKFEQWPALLLSVIVVLLLFSTALVGAFGYLGVEALRNTVPAALEVAKALDRFDQTVKNFNRDLGGGTERIVQTVEVVGKKLDRLPEIERKLDAIPIEVWRAMGSPSVAASDDRPVEFKGGG